MSVAPHEIDIPIRDLDERDDYFRGSEDDRLDFEGIDDPMGPEHTLSSRFAERKNNLSGVFKSAWESVLGPKQYKDYQFVPPRRLDQASDVDDDFDESDGTDANDQLRNFAIRRMNQRLYRTVLLIVVAFILVISVLLLPNWKHSGTSQQKEGSDGNSVHQIHKRIFSNSTHNFYATTIMISLDGFHPHYINSTNCPTMHQMLVNGYAAPYMIPQFPSSTFPNHWTIVTGLHPSEHGIVGNTFYDPKLDLRFVNVDPKSGLDPKFWQGGEPVWLTAARQGVNSAVHMWPGSEVPLNSEHKPLFVDKFNKSESLSNKASRVMEWLDTDAIARRPELILTYVPIVDTIGHKYGIAGQNLTDAIRSVDHFIEMIKDGITQRNLDDIVNLVILSDHGMAPTSKDRLIFLDDLMDLNDVSYFDGWPLIGIRPKEGISVDKMYTDVKSKLSEVPEDLRKNYALYRVEDMPKEWKFGGQADEHRFNYRLAPIWIVPDVGYSLTTHEKFEQNNFEYSPAGVHGYNNTHLLMRATFLAQGPYFKEKLGDDKKIVPFENLNIYNMICDVMDLEPSANNGSLFQSGDYPFAKENVLSSLWSDESVYPGLPFKVDHVVANATYDNLWRKGQLLDSQISSEESEGEEGGGEETDGEETDGEEERLSSEEATTSSQADLASTLTVDTKSATTSTEKETNSSDKPHNGYFDSILGALEDGIEAIDDGIEFVGEHFESGLNIIGNAVDSILGNSNN